jgi:SAM-dependent methyltransferase
MSINDYVLGHSNLEIQRLRLQAAALRPCTHRMLVAAGLREGMRVLDIGCGTGAVSLLAAEMTGPRGQVVAIDQSETAIAVAVDNARDENVSNVHFQVSTLDDFSDNDGFDLVVGRYVLMHQPNAVKFLKQAAQFARPGGCVAFHESDLTYAIPSSPTVELWDALANEIFARFRKLCPEAGIVRNMVPAFFSAGLGDPDMFCEITLGGSNTPLPELFIGVLQTLSNGADRTRLPDGREIEFAPTLLELKRAIAERHAQVHGPNQVCAWARI